MLRDGTCYQDLGPEYFTRRNPAKAAARLANRIRNLGYRNQSCRMKHRIQFLRRRREFITIEGRIMIQPLVTLAVTILLLASASNTATAARVCIGGHFHYGGSGLHHDRVHAQASAVRAWRAIQAQSHGARAAANMYPASNQIHCKHAPGNEGWRCFVRGGPCHTI
jgi:hypothetical protein